MKQAADARMEQAAGTSIFPGIAIGPACKVSRTASFAERRIEDPQVELERLSAALEATKAELTALSESSDELEAALYEVHALLLEDEQYVDAAREKILQESLCAEAAVMQTGRELADLFLAMDDEYMSARSADLLDVSMRLANVLSGNKQQLVLEKPSVLVVEELLPQDFSALDKNLLLGVVASGGSSAAHAAILLRNYGIPSVFGADLDVGDIEEGETIIVDGDSGCVLRQADRETLARYRKLQMQGQAEEDLLQAMRGLPDETPDGQQVRIFANIGKPEELSLVLESDARGIGLFRSEFLFMNRLDAPSEDEQYEAYRTVLAGMGEREVVIRTMDIGADKQAECLNLPSEENPQLGLRAIRICLADTELFRTQLRALLRAAVHGNLHIMYPMITCVQEVRDIKEQVRLSAEELERRGVPYRVPKQGIMIETPAAALVSDLLAQEVDFFSIGTNDLTQYTLAVDRQGKGLERFFDPHHPAVLSLIRMTVENAHKQGIWVGICGELAGDPSLTATFVDYGVDELSLSPSKVLQIRRAVRSYQKQ